MIVIAEHIVEVLEEQIRLQEYLVGKFVQQPTKSGIKKAIKKGQIRINGALTETGRFVCIGDVITLVDTQQYQPKVFEMPIEVVYEDEYLAVVNKPSGVVVSGNQFRTLTNMLPANLTPSTAVDALPWPLPVHRLDSATSGLVMVAKTKKARIALGELLANRQIKKTYRALVAGKLEGAGKVEVAIAGQSCLSIYQAKKVVPSLRSEYITVVDLSPHTGRTHQLRIHMASLGCAIVGDQLYGEKGNVLLHKGLFLAAIGVQFTHPITGQALQIAIEEPNKFGTLLDREEKRWHKFNTEK